MDNGCSTPERLSHDARRVAKMLLPRRFHRTVRTAARKWMRRINNERQTSIRRNRFYWSADDSLYHLEAVRHYHMVMVVGVVSAVDIGDIMGDFSGHRITCGRMERWTQLSLS